AGWRLYPAFHPAWLGRDNHFFNREPNMKKSILAVALLVVAAMAQAETSSAKQELINKVLQLQQSAIDVVSRQLAEGPAIQLMQKAGPVVQFKIPPEKREAVAKDIQADLKKYVDEVTPLVRDRATKLAPVSVGTLLDERFSEDELRQLISVMESPVLRKFSQMNPEFQKVLVDKVIADTKGQIEPKLRALEASLNKRVTAATAK
ncbi:MAG: hypothetical protein NTZ15_10230, partial [Burkholderiales bacterium]|nr:hypothetical protein [Burkholderiales bacterium]